MIGLVLVGLFGILIGLVLLFTSFMPGVRDRLAGFLSRQWFRLLARVFGARARHVGEPAVGPALLAANHVSWLDIIVLGSRVGGCFVSKSEVADWPILGWLAKRGGTLFIHRGHRDSAERIAHEMAERLTSGRQLLFFPEGTTSDGRSVNRFKYRLFVPAVQTATPVQPIALCYELEPGSDPVAYIDGVGFVESVLGVMARSRTDVTLYWNAPLVIDGHDRREIAEMAGTIVSQQMEQHRNGKLHLVHAADDEQVRDAPTGTNYRQ